MNAPAPSDEFDIVVAKVTKRIHSTEDVDYETAWYSYEYNGKTHRMFLREVESTMTVPDLWAETYRRCGGLPQELYVPVDRRTGKAVRSQERRFANTMGCLIVAIGLAFLLLVLGVPMLLAALR